ncbi:MAG: cobaltochelatase subunit CobN [Candidatus Gygaella obscura]|nr:cobaltochelatase subunit CobN [Candidatus Gygaella obscura]
MSRLKLSIVIALLFVAISGFLFLSKPKIVFYGFADFEIAQFKQACQEKDLKISSAEKIPVYFKDIFFRDVLFISTMGQSISERETRNIRLLSFLGVRIIHVNSYRDIFSNVNIQSRNFIKSAYYTGGVKNYKLILDYIKNNFSLKNKNYSLKANPSSGIFVLDENIFQDTGEYLTYLKGLDRDSLDKPRLALVTTNIGPKNEVNKALLRFLINRIEQEGFLVFPVMGLSKETRVSLLKQINPDLIVCSPHGRMFDDEQLKDLFSKIDAPVFLAVNLLQQSYLDWKNNSSRIAAPLLAQSLVMPEIDSGIEPVAVSALSDKDKSGLITLVPIKERIDKLAKRLKKWSILRNKDNSKKKVAVFYYRDFGKSSINVSGLNLSESLYNLLLKLQSSGFNVGKLPLRDEFISQLKQNNIFFGPWHEVDFKNLPEEDFLSIDTLTYQDWVKEEFSEKLKEDILAKKRWLKSNFMIGKINDRQLFKLPVMQFGNIAITPQPPVSELVEEGIIKHDIVETPSDFYCLSYLWAKYGFNADSLIHFGTHGSLEFLHGRESFLDENSYSDALIMDLPHAYIYIVDDVAEALIAKRKTLAVILSHLAPTLIESDCQLGMKDLIDDIHKFLLIKDDFLQKGYLRKITDSILENKLDSLFDLNIENTLITASQIKQIHDRIHHLSREFIPAGLHSYGELPERALQEKLIFSMIRNSLEENISNSLKNSSEEELACHKEQEIEENSLALISRLFDKESLDDILKDYPREWNLAKQDFLNAKNYIKDLEASKDEISSCVRFLEGKYIFPSTGGDAVFNPSSLPTGRNLYGVNPIEIPTKPAWIASKIATDKLIERFRQEHNRFPKKIAFTLWGVNTVMDQGITESQILYLLGVRPVYSNQRQVLSVELIPDEELTRPRVDVLVQISGEYRDNFASRIELIEKAVRLANQAKMHEQFNFVNENSINLFNRLIQLGFEEEKAKQLSTARVFGPKEGSYGTGLSAFFKNTSSWQERSEIAKAHLNNMSYFYSSFGWGEKNSDLLKDLFSETDIVVHTRSTKRFGGPLSLDHTYEFSGGLSLAADLLTGSKTSVFFVDNRNINNPDVLSLKEALTNEAITRLWNPVFLKAMMKESLGGAVEIKKYVENILGWQITNPESVSETIWDKTFEVCVDDSLDIGLDKFLSESNPYVYQDVTSVLLDAARLGFWNPDKDKLNKLTTGYIDSVARKGISCNQRTCANKDIHKYLKDTIQSNRITFEQATFDSFFKNIQDSKVLREVFDPEVIISLKKIRVIK